MDFIFAGEEWFHEINS